MSECVDELPLNLRPIRPICLLNFWRQNDELSVANKFAVLSANGSSVSDSILLKLALQLEKLKEVTKINTCFDLIIPFLSFYNL